MKWICKFCDKEIEYEKFQQKGAHVRNCLNNPEIENINRKTAEAVKAVISVPKIQIIKNCLTCNKEIIQFRSSTEIERNEIQIFCSRKCFFGRNISQETRNKLSIAAHNKNIINPLYKENRINGYKKSFRDKRFEYQKRGIERIKIGEPLYVAGCMLYWGEGSKNINTVQLTNSNPNMLILFKKFLLMYWKLSNENITISINCYTDLHSVEEIEEYWISTLSLTRDNLRKTMINNLPKSSKNTKVNKLEYGTVRLTVNKTEIVQEIFGAIQEFGSFFKSEWIDRKITNKMK